MESARLVEVCLRFGVPMVSPAPPRTRLAELGLSFEPGSLTLISGPSGSGKSLLLAEIGQQYPTGRLVNLVQFPLDVPVLDAVAPARPVGEAMGLLTACGLGEPRLWVRRFEQLSEGERFRARLARGIWLHRREQQTATGASGAIGRVAPLLCDEFGSLLHQRLARAVAFNLRKLINRERLAVVVATSREDVERDLSPDRVVRLASGACGVASGGTGQGGPARNGVSAEKHLRAPAVAAQFSLAERLRIEPGSTKDYADFAAMHYREREQLGFVDKVFVMREGAGGEPLGIVVYGHPALELALRNRVTGRRFVRNARRLNRELRVLKRLVVHPDLRGCGLGRWLTAGTLPLAGTTFVECLATMGAVNPVFQKAGMRWIGTCAAPPHCETILTKLEALGTHPLAADFVSQVCRRAVVRRLVAEGVCGWYRATTGGGDARVARQSPTVLAHTFRQLAGSEPEYFLWARDAAGWAVIDAGLEAMGCESERVGKREGGGKVSRC